jgi:peptidoglycan/xylan/chitin deacetylase (PgdA/CDA1 family)
VLDVTEFKMIYLTGDVHARIKGYWEQEKAGSEVDAAKKYLEILKKNKISCTLFLNGKCLEEEPEKVKELLDYSVEIGGHTYDNFGKMNPVKGYINRKIFGCVYGSSRYQEKDIKKTKRIFERLNLEMNCWRTHAFASNNRTFKMLKENNVRYVSDLVGDVKPFEKCGIVHIPINIPDDVDTISFGFLTPENRNPFASCTKGRIKPEEWFEIVKKRIVGNEKNKIDSILLIHPVTMVVLDNFELFKRTATFLSKYKSGKISEFKI